MKKVVLSLSIIAILTICMFNSVAAAPVNKQTTNVHSNYALDVRGILIDRPDQQTYILTTLGDGDATAVTIGVGQSVYLRGVLSYGTPPNSSHDTSHGIPDKTVNIQSLNSDGQTWTTVATKSTLPDTSQYFGILPQTSGTFIVKLTPTVAGVYTYRVTCDGSSQYAPAVSNAVTLTVTNVAIS